MRHPQDEYDIAIAQLRTIIRDLTNLRTSAKFIAKQNSRITRLISRLRKLAQISSIRIVDMIYSPLSKRQQCKNRSTRHEQETKTVRTAVTACVAGNGKETMQ